MIDLADKFTPVALLLPLAVEIVALGLMFANPSRLRTASLVAISEPTGSDPAPKGSRLRAKSEIFRPRIA